MKFRTLLPFILVSYIWACYTGLAIGESNFSAYTIAIGSVLAMVGIPYGIALIGKRNNPRRQFTTFFIVWCIFIIANVVTFFHEQ
jgi:hypothetical protein